MGWLYRSFEASLLGIALCLGACIASGGQRPPADTPLSVDLPMLSVTAPAAR